MNIISISAHCSHPGWAHTYACKTGLKWAGRAVYGEPRLEIERGWGDLTELCAVLELAELSCTGWDVSPVLIMGSCLAATRCAQPLSPMPCELVHHLMLVPVPCPGVELCGWCCSFSYCLTNWDSVLARVQGWAIKICSSLKSAIKLVSGEWMYLPGRRGKWAQPLIKEKVLVSVTDFSDCFIFSITFKSPRIFSCRLLTHLLEILFT